MIGKNLGLALLPRLDFSGMIITHCSLELKCMPLSLANFAGLELLASSNSLASRSTDITGMSHCTCLHIFKTYNLIRSPPIIPKRFLMPVCHSPCQFSTCPIPRKPAICFLP
uniref:Uncharacterized protein n=1 Tax=Piliocolobus tephrosceles TaxID=591936 RepID=A0A8C9HLC6_9PRIM